jgi:glycosyltransferase involved in cell wall biosynthesis
MEIILIDDGSTDGSGELCDRLACQDSRIRVKHISNSGPFTARKTGVELARGDVVTFVDSDDWMEPNAYSEVMAIYRKYKPDIIAYAYREGGNGQIISENCYPEGYYDREDIEKVIIPTMMCDFDTGVRKLSPSVGCKLFQKKTYEKVMQKINRRITWGEDALVTYPAVCMAESLYVSHTAYYNYRRNETSLVHSSPSERMDEVDNFACEMRKILLPYDKKYGLEVQIDAYIRHFFDMFTMNRFGIHCVGSRYAFPYSDIPYKSRVQIYGAGDVGKSYICELLQSKFAEIAGWYDSTANDLDSYAGIQIELPEKITEIQSDFVMIAIYDVDVVEQVREKLKELGVQPDKIYWTLPKKRM